MGKFNKALNRTSFNWKAGAGKPRFNKVPNWVQRTQKTEAKEPKMQLKIINISSEQEQRKDLKSVYDLPASVKEVKKLLRTVESEEDKTLIVQRIRDYHNPILNPENEDKFKQFILHLMQYFLSYDSDSLALKKHIQELCCSPHGGSLFSVYFKSKLLKIVEVLRSVKESEQDGKLKGASGSLDQVLKSIVECQVFASEVLECPTNSKLVEVLEQATSQVYLMGHNFTCSANDGEAMDLVLKIVENDLKICSKLGKTGFNPALSSILLKLISAAAKVKDEDKKQLILDLYLKYQENIKALPSFSIISLEVNKLVSDSSSGLLPKEFKSALKRFKAESKSKGKLTYLQLQTKKPKELPSFAPHIDDDFMLFGDKKYKVKEEDEREVKRKLKKVEKDAARELRKDTMQVQVQRQKELSYRSNMLKKNVIRAGNIRDEI